MEFLTYRRHRVDYVEQDSTICLNHRYRGASRQFSATVLNWTIKNCVFRRGSSKGYSRMRLKIRVNMPAFIGVDIGVVSQSLATGFIIIFVFSSPRPLPCINKGAGRWNTKIIIKTVTSDCGLFPWNSVLVVLLSHAVKPWGPSEMSLWIGVVVSTNIFRSFLKMCSSSKDTLSILTKSCVWYVSYTIVRW